MNQIRLLFFLFYFVCFEVIAVYGQQYVDLARITSSITPQNSFDSSQTSTFVRENVSDITLPLKLNDSLAIVTGLLYENLYAKTTERSTAYTSAHGITLKVGLNFTHNERWKSTFVFMPKLSSDLKRVNSNDFQFGGSILVKYKKSDFFTWQFGGYYNGELFGPFFVPFLGMYYHSPNQRFEANVLLPASVDMNYSFTPKLRLGGSFVSFVKTFHIHEQSGPSPTSYWNKSTNEIFAYLQVEPVRGLLIQGRAGYSVARRFTMYDSADKISFAIMAFKFEDDRTRNNQWFADGGIFQLRLIYRYYLD
jgi:hypothetical protein